MGLHTNWSSENLIRTTLKNQQPTHCLPLDKSAQWRQPVPTRDKVRRLFFSATVLLWRLFGIPFPYLTAFVTFQSIKIVLVDDF